MLMQTEEKLKQIQKEWEDFVKLSKKGGIVCFADVPINMYLTKEGKEELNKATNVLLEACENKEMKDVLLKSDSAISKSFAKDQDSEDLWENIEDSYMYAFLITAIMGGKSINKLRSYLKDEDIDNYIPLAVKVANASNKEYKYKADYNKYAEDLINRAKSQPGE